jgi:dissimilatory sulfite reductase (desulfoviridin) alpha/beta subunit
MATSSPGISITVLLPSGRLSLDIMKATHDLATKYGFSIYCSLSQNIRLINVPETAVNPIKKELAILGAKFKAPGQFPLPRICIGKPHCSFGLVDTEKLSNELLKRFNGRENTKAKFRISIAGCTVGCPWTKNSDISIMASRVGYSVYAGGKGGMVPRSGIRIKTKATEQEVLDIVEALVDFHDLKTKNKQRMSKLINDPDFPFSEV